MTLVRRNGVVDPTALPSEKAAARLSRQMIFMTDQPSVSAPSLPDDITDLSDEELMSLFTRVTKWCAYLATRTAMAFVDERAAETALEVEEAKVLIRDWGGTAKDRVTVDKAKRAADPQVTKLRDQLSERYADRKLIEVMANNLDEDRKLISRELTRRTATYDVGQRASRFA